MPNEPPHRAPRAPDLEHGHSPDAVRARILSGPDRSYVRDWVYGGIDGAITTFAIVAGVTGGDLSARVVVILGLANVIADGFSMAASNYSGTKSEQNEYNHLRAMEERHIERAPGGEAEEIRQIYRAKGFRGRDLERAVRVITADRQRWINTMMTEEHGQPQVMRAPIKSAASTFAAFVLCGMIPLLPFLIGLGTPFALSLGLTAVVFFGIGAAQSPWSLATWWQSGLETLGIGLGAASLAYAIGYGLKSLV